MNFTLFGYPKAGKTTLFNILTGARAEISAYEGGRREAHERIVPLPDPRLERLAALYPDKKKTAAAVEIIDLAGVSYGEVKDTVFLNSLRQADILVHVVRGFRDSLVPHAKPVIDPAAEIRAMEDELILADLVQVETRLAKLDLDLKKAKNPEAEKERDILRRIQPHLEGGSPLRTRAWAEAEERQVRAFAFLSLKPILHIVNGDEADVSKLPALEKESGPPSLNAAILAACGRIECEILDIEDPGDKAAFLAEYGLKETTPARFFSAVIGLMNLIFFYTIGKDEVRAWPLRRNAPALRAAGTIHTDIEKGFIRAEVVAAEELFRLGSWQQAKEAGALRLEGRDYIVRDGDVIYFRFAA